STSAGRPSNRIAVASRTYRTTSRRSATSWTEVAGAAGKAKPIASAFSGGTVSGGRPIGLIDPADRRRRRPPRRPRLARVRGADAHAGVPRLGSSPPYLIRDWPERGRPAAPGEGPRPGGSWGCAVWPTHPTLPLLARVHAHTSSYDDRPTRGSLSRT